MSLFKCKMCGGDLEIIDGASVAKCIYCRTTQTVPKEVDESLQNLFNRANALRIKGEFDKAEKLYERIIQQDTTQSEAYWGLILSKYGIEYVDDPATGKKVPTCHRASYDSIVADDDFKAALENCDASQRAIYEEQAKEIDRIQKEILALAQKEERYDVFICYKETDENGHRTQDSVIANDIYYQLTERGFKVFYAAITLEGKLGSAYEPIIFAALNSAKVMLAVGTKPEYFNAVWVKNEWSRYLKIIKRDRTKLLIPCYRDMDAYDLPEEFAHLQAQDMAKIGFISDIVRGIKKVLTLDAPKPKAPETIVKETVVTAASAPGIAPLLKRAFMFLEDGEFDRADDFCEQVLNQDPENAEAYLGKLMVELKVKRKSELANCASPFDNSKNYQKLVRYADATLVAELKEYIDAIKDRKAEEARKETIYIKAINDFNSTDVSRIQNSITLFESLGEYKDSAERINMYETRIAQLRAKEKNSIYQSAVELISWKVYNTTTLPAINTFAPIDNFERAIELFTQVGDWKDAKEMISKCRAHIKIKRERAKFFKIASLLIALSFIILTIGYLVYSLVSPVSLNYSVNVDGKTCTITGMESTSVTDLVIPAEINGYKVTSIGSSAFLGCSSLASVTMPDSVKTIGDYAFRDCTSLTSVTIPDSVTSIGYGAFSGCTSLTSIFFNGTVPEWKAISFGTDWNKTVPATKVVCYDENVRIKDSEGLAYSVNTGFATCTITGIGTCTDTELSIPAYIDGFEVTSIGELAFKGCKSLSSVTIPVSVTSIGSYAFNGCASLTSVIMPNSIISIGVSVFYNCTSLTSITLPDSVTSIGAGAFSNCTSLTSITIPDSVTSIDSRAFYGCTSLAKINYRGSSAKWNAVSKGTNWDAYYDGSNYRKINYTMMYNYTGG